MKQWYNGALIKAYRSDILPFSTLLFTVSTTVSCTISNGGGNGNTDWGVLSLGFQNPIFFFLKLKCFQQGNDGQPTKMGPSNEIITCFTKIFQNQILQIAISQFLVKYPF